MIGDFGGVLTTPLSAGFLAYQEEAGVPLEELGRAMQRRGGRAVLADISRKVRPDRGAWY